MDGGRTLETRIHILSATCSQGMVKVREKLVLSSMSLVTFSTFNQDQDLPVVFHGTIIYHVHTCN